ncbi:hypothetical protein HYU14_02835 [Candidatus Woesearchaeota archaeon]|nr:hypothetical protein [Candidatus Woesearchaeota archaeon]
MPQAVDKKERQLIIILGILIAYLTYILVKEQSLASTLIFLPLIILTFYILRTTRAHKPHRQLSHADVFLVAKPVMMAVILIAISLFIENIYLILALVVAFALIISTAIHHLSPKKRDRKIKRRKA